MKKVLQATDSATAGGVAVIGVCRLHAGREGSQDAGAFGCQTAPSPAAPQSSKCRERYRFVIADSLLTAACPVLHAAICSLCCRPRARLHISASYAQLRAPIAE